MTDTDLQVEPGDNQEPSVPEWIPEKFRANPEKFGEAYTNLERELTSRSTREKELQQQVEYYESALAAQQQQAPPTQDDAHPYVLAYEQAMENGDYRTAMQYSALVAQEAARSVVAPQFQKQTEALGKQALEYAWTSLNTKYQDVNEYRDGIAEVVNNYPGLIPEDKATDPAYMTQALETAYKLANPSAFVPGQPVDTTAAKLAAQGLPGAAGRPPSPDAAKEEWATIMAAGKTEPGRYY